MKTRFMKTLTQLSAAGLAGMSLLACAPENPALTAPPEYLAAIEQQAPGSNEYEYKPMVDILFVIDNSDSMKTHQANLKKNIDRFVEAFEANERVDFHIGAVSIFDSKRFGPVVKDFYPIGKLRPLKDPNRPGEEIPGSQFVTREEGYIEVLGETLKIGTQARGRGNGGPDDLGGPEYEEAFSPVVAAFDGRNPGFFRDKAHLAVIMITDANDESAMTPSELNRYLYDLKGGNYSTYAVLALKNCTRDPGGAPDKILEFIRLSGGHAYNLCDKNYGDRLAEAGRLIQEKASRARIRLNSIPEISTLEVKFDGKIVKQDPQTGWSYDNESVSIIINGGAKLEGAADGKLTIEYVPVDPRRFGTERVRAVDTL